MVHFHLSTPYLFIKRCSFNVFCLFHSSEEQSNNDYFIYDCNLVTNHILHYFFLGDDWGRAITSQSLQAASLLDRNYIISRISTFNSVSEHDYLLLFTFLFFFWCDHSNIWKCISKFLLCSTYHYSTRTRSYSATSCGWVHVCSIYQANKIQKVEHPWFLPLIFSSAMHFVFMSILGSLCLKEVKQLKELGCRYSWCNYEDVPLWRVALFLQGNEHEDCTECSCSLCTFHG